MMLLPSKQSLKFLPVVVKRVAGALPLLADTVKADELVAVPPEVVTRKSPVVLAEVSVAVICVSLFMV